MHLAAPRLGIEIAPPRHLPCSQHTATGICGCNKMGMAYRQAQGFVQVVTHAQADRTMFQHHPASPTAQSAQQPRLATAAVANNTICVHCRRYNLVNKRLPGWQDPPNRDAIQVSQAGTMPHSCAGRLSQRGLPPCFSLCAALSRGFVSLPLCYPLSKTQPMSLSVSCCVRVVVLVILEGLCQS